MSNEVKRVTDHSVEERIRVEIAEIDKRLYTGDDRYCQYMLDKICELISVGHTMGEVSNIVGVSSQTIYKWSWKNKGFAEAIILARQSQAHVLIDKAHEAIREGASLGREKDVKFTADGFIKLAEKINPKKYGVKLVEYSGETDLRVTDDQRTRRILELLASNAPEVIEQAIQVDALPNYASFGEDDAGAEESPAWESSDDEGERR